MDDVGGCTVTVDLGIALAGHVTVAQYRRPKIKMRLERSITLDCLIRRLGIPGAYVGFVTINGEKRSWDTLVAPNDAIVLFPYITGG